MSGVDVPICFLSSPAFIVPAGDPFAKPGDGDMVLVMQSGALSMGLAIGAEAWPLTCYHQRRLPLPSRGQQIGKPECQSLRCEDKPGCQGKQSTSLCTPLRVLSAADEPTAYSAQRSSAQRHSPLKTGGAAILSLTVKTRMADRWYSPLCTGRILGVAASGRFKRGQFPRAARH